MNESVSDSMNELLSDSVSQIEQAIDDVEKFDNWDKMVSLM